MKDRKISSAVRLSQVHRFFFIYSNSLFEPSAVYAFLTRHNDDRRWSYSLIGRVPVLNFYFSLLERFEYLSIFFSRKIIQLQHLTILLRVKANPSMDDSIMHRTHKKYRLANCLQITPPCRLCSAAIIGRLSCFEREESWHRCWLVKHNFCLNGCFRRDESTCSVQLQPRAVCAIPEHM